MWDVSYFYILSSSVDGEIVFRLAKYGMKMSVLSTKTV